jgi:hypothetical protein
MGKIRIPHSEIGIDCIVLNFYHIVKTQPIDNNLYPQFVPNFEDTPTANGVVLTPMGISFSIATVKNDVNSP